MPDNLRAVFYKYSEALYGKFFSCGVKCLDAFFSDVRGKALKGGYIVVLQTHGRSGQYNPHLHIISTSGGLGKANNKWEHLDYLPYPYRFISNGGGHFYWPKGGQFNLAIDSNERVRERSMLPLPNSTTTSYRYLLCL